MSRTDEQRSSSLTYPTRRRLTRRHQYQRVYGEGLRVASRSLVLFAMRNGGEGPRLGVTATRKIGGAVVRNRAKRLVREAFRIQAVRFDGWDLVVNVRQSTPGRSSKEVALELAKSFERLRRRAASRSSGR